MDDVRISPRLATMMTSGWSYRDDRLITDGDPPEALAKGALEESADIIQGLRAAVGRSVCLGFRFSSFALTRMRKLSELLAKQGCVELEITQEPDIAEEVISLRGRTPTIQVSNERVVPNWILNMCVMGAPYCLFDFISFWQTVDEGEPLGARLGGDDDDDFLQRRVRCAIKGDCHVVYSAYEMGDGDNTLVDNLDQPAWRGKCQFVQEADELFGKGSNYKSPIVESPTWLQVAVLANEMIKVTGDYHHRFLEGVEEGEGSTGSAQLLSFAMGS